MPRCISFKGGGKTEYIYSATGEKLQVKHIPSIGDKEIITNYCGEAVFDDINLETVFLMVDTCLTNILQSQFFIIMSKIIKVPIESYIMPK